jgi:hypothetical protein
MSGRENVGSASAGIANDDPTMPAGRVGSGVGWWVRLVFAAGCLAVGVGICGRWFLDHARGVQNSPGALVVLVLLTQCAWFISRSPAGGVIAWLKIVLGLCTLLLALLGPSHGIASWSHRPDERTGTKQIVAGLLATWVIVDGFRERHKNLRDPRNIARHQPAPRVTDPSTPLRTGQLPVLRSVGRLGPSGDPSSHKNQRRHRPTAER